MFAPSREIHRTIEGEHVHEEAGKNGTGEKSNSTMKRKINLYLLRIDLPRPKHQNFYLNSKTIEKFAPA